MNCLCAEKFIQTLESKGMNYTHHVLEGGEVLVNFPYEGKVARLVFAGEDGHYFSLYLILERVPEEKTADIIYACNELNSKYKWVTFYLDDDNDLTLHDDAILVPESAVDEVFELLLRMLNVADDVKPTLMKAIYA